MKRNLTVILITAICLVSICCLITYAHPGRTDQNGGHYNHSTGEYHYHTEEYAGREPSSNIPWWWDLLFLHLILLIIGLVLHMWWRISNSLPHKIIFNLEQAIFDYKNAKSHTDFCNKKLKKTEEAAIIPDGYEIGKDGLPKEINSTPLTKEQNSILTTDFESININWGKSLTVYTVSDGWKLHLNKDCGNAFFMHRRNVYSFCNKRYSLCKICAQNYQVPNMEWYVEYLKLDSQRKAYEYAIREQTNALIALQNCNSNCNKKLVKLFLFFSPSKKKKVNELKKQYAAVL